MKEEEKQDQGPQKKTTFTMGPPPAQVKQTEPDFGSLATVPWGSGPDIILSDSGLDFAAIGDGVNEDELIPSSQASVHEQVQSFTQKLSAKKEKQKKVRGAKEQPPKSEK